MQRFTDMLLGIDLTGTSGGSIPIAPTSLPPVEEATAPPVEKTMVKSEGQPHPSLPFSGCGSIK